MTLLKYTTWLRFETNVVIEGFHVLELGATETSGLASLKILRGPILGALFWGWSFKLKAPSDSEI